MCHRFSIYNQTVAIALRWRKINELFHLFACATYTITLYCSCHFVIIQHNSPTIVNVFFFAIVPFDFHALWFPILVIFCLANVLLSVDIPFNECWMSIGMNVATTNWVVGCVKHLVYTPHTLIKYLPNTI